MKALIVRSGGIILPGVVKATVETHTIKLHPSDAKLETRIAAAWDTRCTSTRCMGRIPRSTVPRGTFPRGTFPRGTFPMILYH
jgi:hypothetical protein